MVNIHAISLLVFYYFSFVLFLLLKYIVDLCCCIYGLYLLFFTITKYIVLLVNSL